jgi:hypothetical protein
LFLQEQHRSLEKTLNDVVKNYPEASNENEFVSGYEAKLVLLSLHLSGISRHWYMGINCVEDMLRNQLISAIGKEVDGKDFTDFLRFHNQRVFPKAYSPKPFCYAIRQPNHYPDGVLSIVTNQDEPGPTGGLERNKQNEDPIETFVRHLPGDNLATPMSIPLNAATTLEFVGDQYLHGWMDTNFAGQRNMNHSISAMARQFSCFLLMIVNISGPHEFTPSDAIILQNKDEVLIPLLTNALPSAKEFRDAIQSLSPEQARFAKSYRSMQLDSSVFGICVIQVKPQLEVLLQLPPGALTKEIKLTQELMSLFVDYQIPPTLVSFDGDEAIPLSEKVSAVQQHVKGVLDVIQGMKESQLEDEKKKAAARVEMARRTVDDFNAEETELRKKAGREKMALHSRVELASATRMVAPQFHSTAAPRKAMASATMMAAPAMESFSAAAEDACFDDTFLGTDDGFDTLQDEHLSGKDGTGEMDRLGAPSAQTDFTSIPKKLDKMFESYDKEGALRTVTLKTGGEWTRQRQENLLTKMQKARLQSDDQKTETNKALDLLDALSRSGSLPIASGELHVLIGVRHSFEQNIMATVIQGSVNPIEKVDYSSLLIAATVHQVDIPTLLVNSAEPPTLVLEDGNFPALMIGNAGDNEDDGTKEE